MSGILWLVPVALLMGLAGLGAFLWSMRTGQYDDLDGAAERVVTDAKSDQPLVEPDDWRPETEGEANRLR
ncbi:cbb3-type cytochrome oxidase assembly protein CcoS [Sphingomonas histidinilytica]|jgi:cbb3-type cytochrome oxidase maturation protein|uniref:Cytochrome oxidase maturation protein, cbb3-type n=8 Tax=Sphingomonadaceae TaxID=41297 RepID=A0A086PDJ4_SPHHM|nr:MULTISPECIES: cbb3-type cytochrome oxidase assembly protein CcoS [Sphingomonadaceae]ARR57450.1 cbb3-type cytochrome oxidase assembly protein CcoS [Rhizorhabdus wittichii DC-6]OAP32470.1 cytochrome oxidase maturation protein, cbb3-type [Sphingobium sp. 20006FA]AGH51724.1 cbb3-type cytochrome oxidase maturation protein [Sphingomonas sp. MM-1]API61584.1 cytochrome oxidase maturation protein, cbb3-type [Tardibacter chloracetimidivorans]ATE67802.1 cbb3-type cytochrome oxidase assembly protein Cc